MEQKGSNLLHWQPKLWNKDLPPPTSKIIIIIYQITEHYQFLERILCTWWYHHRSVINCQEETKTISWFCGAESQVRCSYLQSCCVVVQCRVVILLSSILWAASMRGLRVVVEVAILRKGCLSSSSESALSSALTQRQRLRKSCKKSEFSWYAWQQATTWLSSFYIIVFKSFQS